MSWSTNASRSAGDRVSRSQPDRICEDGLAFGIRAGLEAHHRVGHAQAGGPFRMKNPAAHLPGDLEAMHAVSKAMEKGGVPRVVLELTNLRASQINGCSVCGDIHCRVLKKLGEKGERIHSVSAWREAPYHSDKERAALALAEAMSRLSDRADPVPDDVWNEAARHYEDAELCALVTSIGLINMFKCSTESTRPRVRSAANGSPTCRRATETLPEKEVLAESAILERPRVSASRRRWLSGRDSQLIFGRAVVGSYFQTRQPE
jgi:AhpD family alkylhydroperoxidase